MQGYEVPFEERLGLTNVARLQDFDERVDQESRQRNARNASEALTELLQLFRCPPDALTTGLMAANTAQGDQAVPTAIKQGMAGRSAAAPLLRNASPVLSQQEHQQPEAKVQRDKRQNLRAQQPVAAAPLVAGKTRQQRPCPNPGGRTTPANCTACRKSRIGHPKSGCPTHCMKCKKTVAECACPGGPHPESYHKSRAAVIC